MFVSSSHVADVLHIVANFAAAYAERQSAPSSAGPPTPTATPAHASTAAGGLTVFSFGSEVTGQKHRVYVAACQLLMYSLCFRVEDLAADGLLSDELRELLGRALTPSTGLSPFPLVLPSVMNEYARVASAYALPFRPVLPHERSATHAEPFFPFDPFSLRESRDFISPLYREWPAASPDAISEASEWESDEWSDM
eukprot:gnl/Ergobibamus_cyprinoides/1716.p1 GENE.gnl/Ergobibamus_cyprinoides/1716~~gnl/Ergobibamus_cyprinoides/1716.p1  ORF type:complete len:196 (+),score=29.85 gnl/Ergobibamus_cyprinoides/1716:500-1087(+)